MRPVHAQSWDTNDETVVRCSLPYGHKYYISSENNFSGLLRVRLVIRGRIEANVNLRELIYLNKKSGLPIYDGVLSLADTTKGDRFYRNVDERGRVDIEMTLSKTKYEDIPKILIS